MRKKEGMMNKVEMLDFLNSNPVCHLATIDGDQLRVRGMLIYHADENGILFHTGSFKDLYKQMQQNPNAELCFSSADSSKQVRVSGEAGFIEDQNLKEEIVNKRSFLKPWVEEQGYDMLKVFRVTNCTSTIRTMETNFEPKKYVHL
ncbi:MAG: Pyridoxine/pyridoxamine 5'-phosphate oxidase [Candidatus Methanogaster sp.]|nr:MAG: Pyridoxine/pyridoxamine 5'-phosphate oxidase [ANME-2 cluster archaeon]